MALKCPTIKLDVWKGDWGLPSVDIECLRFMACTRFSNLEFDVKKTNNPFWTPNGALPVAHYGSRDITDFDDLQALLKFKNMSPDEGLSKKQLAEAEAYTNMLKEKLYPAILYTWWIDEKNFTTLTKPWYAKALPFPFNFYYPRKFKNHANSVMEALFDSLGSQDNIETKVYSDASKCLTSLSVRLDSSEFMFGAHPTSIDATLFAYLAPLLKVPFKNTLLQNHLKECHNLQKFVIRILQRYFPKDCQDYETQRRNEAKSNVGSNDTEFPNKRRNQFFATLFAVIAMLSYAVSAGIVQNPHIDAKSSVDEELLLFEPPEDYGEEN
ncbi:metaxin-1 isoform X2 [Rhodnius prolixus]|uniref:Putative translocase of outer mitochondrial membrane complex n=2 Tax=Rhodnius TaxID=13248 RepID=R4G7S9_RHOPR